MKKASIDKVLNMLNGFVSLATDPVFMFHGTSIDNFQSILDKGLLTNPPKKVWEEDLGASFKNPSRVVLGGVYFTTHLDLAIKAIKNATKGKLEGILIISKIDMDTLYADEDDVSKLLSELKVEDKLDEQTSVKLWASILLKLNPGLVENTRSKYVQFCLSKIKKLFSKDLSPDLEQQIIVELEKGFYAALKRQVSYVPKSTYNSVMVDTYVKSKQLSRTIFNEANSFVRNTQPSVSDANDEYRKYLHNITSLSKDIVNTTGTGRSLQDVGFSGDNKIIGIVKIPSAEVLFSSEEIPQELISRIRNVVDAIK